MRLIFAGTPEAAVPSLAALIAGEHEVVAVLTRPDAPLGRKRVLTPSPVAQLAEQHGLPVIKAAKLTPEVVAELVALEADLGVIVAYGALLRRDALDAPRLGWINLHFSLLPAWRGAAPVQRAVLAGETKTGMSVFQLVEELDAGPLFATGSYPIGRHQTSGSLLEELSEHGALLLARVVDELAAGTAMTIEQRGEPSYAAKITLADGLIDWAEPAPRVLDRIRGANPEPGAHTLLAGERFKVHRAALVPAEGLVPALAPGALALESRRVLAGTGDGVIELLEVQPAGRTAMAAADWWRGLGAEAKPVLG